MLVLDHIAVVAETLDAGQAWVEERLGIKMEPGGQHPVMGTHNRLMGLEGGEYLEVIAIDPSLPTPARARWFGLDQVSGPPRLGNWICRCASLNAMLEILPNTVGEPVALSRGSLSWKMVVPEDGILPFDQTFPALIEWQSGGHPAQSLRQTGCRLTGIGIQHPRAAELSNLLAPYVSDPRVTFANGAPRLLAEITTAQGKKVTL